MTFHSRIVSSPPPSPAASTRPSGLNVTENTGPAGPVRDFLIGAAFAGSLTFHSPMVPSSFPVARVCPSGLKATDQIRPPVPVRGAPIGVA